MLEALEADGNSSSATTNPIPWTIDYTIPVHGEGRGFAACLGRDPAGRHRNAGGAAAWAVRLAETYAQVEPAALRLCGMSR